MTRAHSWSMATVGLLVLTMACNSGDAEGQDDAELCARIQQIAGLETNAMIAAGLADLVYERYRIVPYVKKGIRYPLGSGVYATPEEGDEWRLETSNGQTVRLKVGDGIALVGGEIAEGPVAPEGAHGVKWVANLIDGPLCVVDLESGTVGMLRADD